MLCTSLHRLEVQRPGELKRHRSQHDLSINEVGKGNELVMQVDMTKGATGLIIWVSGDCMHLTGMSETSLIGQNISLLTPLSISVSHNRLIEAFMQSGRPGIHLKKNELIIVGGQQKGLRANIWIKPSFDLLTSRFRLNTHIKEVKANEIFMLIDDLGFIEVVSKSCFDVFEAYFGDFPRTKPSIFMFSPDLLNFFYRRSPRFKLRFNQEQHECCMMTNKGCDELTLIKEKWFIATSINKINAKAMDVLNNDNLMYYDKLSAFMHAVSRASSGNYAVEFRIKEFISLDGKVLNYIINFENLNCLYEAGSPGRKSLLVDPLFISQSTDQIGVLRKTDSIGLGRLGEGREYLADEPGRDGGGNQISGDLKYLLADSRAKPKNLRTRMITINEQMRRSSMANPKNKSKTAPALNDVNCSQMSTSHNQKHKRPSATSIRGIRFKMRLSLVVLSFTMAAMFLCVILLFKNTEIATKKYLKTRSSFMVHAFSYLSQMLRAYNFQSIVRILPTSYSQSTSFENLYALYMKEGYTDFRKSEMFISSHLLVNHEEKQTIFAQNYGRLINLSKIVQLFFIKPINVYQNYRYIYLFEQTARKTKFTSILKSVDQELIEYFDVSFTFVRRVVIGLAGLVVLVGVLTKLLLERSLVRDLNTLIKGIGNLSDAELDKILKFKSQSVIGATSRYDQELVTNLLNSGKSSSSVQLKDPLAKKSIKTFASSYGHKRIAVWNILIAVICSLMVLTGVPFTSMPLAAISQFNSFFEKNFKNAFRATVSEFYLVLLTVNHYNGMPLNPDFASTFNIADMVAQVKARGGLEAEFGDYFELFKTGYVKLEESFAPWVNILVASYRAFYETNLCAFEKLREIPAFDQFCASGSLTDTSITLVNTNILINRIKSKLVEYFVLVNTPLPLLKYLMDKSSNRNSSALVDIFNLTLEIGELAAVLDKFMVDFFSNTLIQKIDDYSKTLSIIFLMVSILLVAVGYLTAAHDARTRQPLYELLESGLWFIETMPVEVVHRMRLRKFMAQDTSTINKNYI